MVYGANARDYKDITLSVANTGGDQQVVLIVVKGNTPGKKVQLAITSSNVQPLDINDRHFGTVKNLDGKFKIYEVMVPQSKLENYVVEVENCEGSTEIYVADTFGDLMESKFESRTSKSEFGKIYATLKAPSEGIKKYVVAIKSNNVR